MKGYYRDTDYTHDVWRISYSAYSESCDPAGTLCNYVAAQETRR